MNGDIVKNKSVFFDFLYSWVSQKLYQLSYLAKDIIKLVKAGCTEFVYGT